MHQSVIEDCSGTAIIGYTHYLLMKGQIAGNMISDGHKKTDVEREISDQCRTLCGKLSDRLSTCEDEEISDLLECYDMAYRLGYGKMPDRAFINKNKRRILAAWKSGNRRIGESVIFRIASFEVICNREKADSEYAGMYQSLKKKWLPILLKYNRFPDATAYENYQRLALMMRESISAGTGTNDNCVKQLWYECNRIEDLPTLATTVLRSYRRFASSLFPTVLDYDEQIALDNHILAELIGRRDLSYHDREAYRLALEFNQRLMSD